MNNMNEQTSRREFLKIIGEGLTGITIVGFVPAFINSCSNPAGPNAAPFNITVDVSSLTANNQGLRTNTPDGNTLLVVRQSATSYLAILLVCTHAGCGGPDMQQSGTVIVCRCHGSEFNLQGQVVLGPASSNLTTYPAAYNATTK